MITLAICDAEALFRKNINTACRSYFVNRGIDYEVYEYASGEEFLVENYPDILIMDVRLKRLSGILVKDILAKMQAETRIIFVSKNKNDVTDAFGKNVYGYLIKPLKYESFCRKMDEIMEDIMMQQNYIFCKNGDRFEKIYYKNILYIEASASFTKVHIQGKNEYRKSELTLVKWEELLKNCEFVRCSRKHMVNMLYVIDIKREIELISKITIPLGVPYKEKVMEKYYADKSKRAILCGNARRAAGRTDEVHR